MNVAAFTTQSAALLLDAYRELNSKKLFWVTLAISLLVVLAFAAIGLNDKGITLLGWEFDTAPFTSRLLSPAKFYLFLFANFAVPIWLTWLASILALISTAGMFPDFLAGGAIELALARPISRLRLFAVKYACGLLFVTLQVALFALACFGVVGLRGGSWEPRIFLAVPIVVLFFSYLFAFCTLFGVLTRSTIASLLLTLLVWFCLWALNTTAATFLVLRESQVLNAERAARRVEKLEDSGRKKIAELVAKSEPVPGTAGTDLPVGAADAFEAVVPTLGKARSEAREAEAKAAGWRRASGVVNAVKGVLPKTDETIALLERWMLTAADRRPFGGGAAPPAEDAPLPFGVPDNEAVQRVDRIVRDRSVGWVLGSSCLAEAVIFGLAAWIFCRRDF
jgi:ABC-type transport system involved in multi-copper enzyme maturation permease subunit